jgi:TRAP-type C4-dicarboxylate transport system substrate-binding protein
VYPASSLVKTFAQFGALRKGALDMSVLPIAYGGGEVPEANLGLMPALISSYEQGLRWKSAPIGAELDKILQAKGIKIVTWVWQAGGIASRGNPIVSPEDAKGLKIRGGDKTMDLMLQGAGGSATNLPSSEIYSAMSTGVLDAALTSSTSLISYRLQETAKAVTTARNKSFWFMFEPLLISKATWDSLTPAQQKIVTEVGASLEPFAMAGAKADDQRLADVYAKAGVKVVDMDQAAFDKWLAIARNTAYKNFASGVKNGQQLLDMALAVK